MFNNPLKKYQQGGTAMTIPEAEEELINAIVEELQAQGIQKSVEEVKNRYEQIKSNPEGEEYKKLTDAITLMETDKKSGFSKILSLFATPSNKFGGKIQDFICKHAKGGTVTGCGCAKKAADGTVIDGPEGYVWGRYDKSHFLNSGPDHKGWTKVQTPDGRHGYARNYRNRILGIPSRNLNQVLITPDEDEIMRSSSRDLMGFFGKGDIDTTYNSWNGSKVGKKFIENMNGALEGVAPERPVKEQEGGELSRRQALDLGMKNKGFTRSQARIALANAKNTLRNNGVRGREMRRLAREWVAGESPVQQREPIQDISVFNPLTTNNIDNRAIRIKNQSPVNTRSSILGRLSSMSFNDAFANARRAGVGVFNWRNKPYTTELATTDDSRKPFTDQSGIQIPVIEDLPIEINDEPINVPEMPMGEIKQIAYPPLEPTDIDFVEMPLDIHYIPYPPVPQRIKQGLTYNTPGIDSTIPGYKITKNQPGGKLDNNTKRHRRINKYRGEINTNPNITPKDSSEVKHSFDGYHWPVNKVMPDIEFLHFTNTDGKPVRMFKDPKLNGFIYSDSDKWGLGTYYSPDNNSVTRNYSGTSYLVGPTARDFVPANENLINDANNLFDYARKINSEQQGGKLK